jgi:phosphate acyltransferase
MGGEGGVKVTLPATLHALEVNSDLSVYLVGDKSQIEPYMDSVSASCVGRIQIEHTADLIADADKPSQWLAQVIQARY